MSTLILLAPLDGWSTPLEEAPDPVFAGRMLGDGVAIDPTSSTLHAPCDAWVSGVPASKHALTLRTPCGAEILLHVGIDTVGLGGEGFELHVTAGEAIEAGQPLLSFDLDLLASRARSLLTPIILTNPATHAIVRRHQGQSVSTGDFLMEVQLVRAGRESPPEASGIDTGGGIEMTRSVRVMLPHGIHARPAGLLAARARSFAANVSVSASGRTVSAGSAMALMTLGVRGGDEVLLRAAGADAAAALDAAEAVLRSRLHDQDAPWPTRPAQPAQHAAPGVTTNDAKALRGAVASPGLAIGQAVQLDSDDVEVQEVGEGVAHETAELQRARSRVSGELAELAKLAATEPARQILTAHRELLRDSELESHAKSLIAQGKSAGFAWRSALRAAAEALVALGDARMAERVADLRDLERRVLGALHDAGRAQSVLPESAIVIARDLLPSQLVSLQGSRLAGLCIVGSGPTSHVAILAASMGIPALVGADAAVLAIPEGTTLVLDAQRGVLRVEPKPDELAQAAAAVASMRKHREAEQALAREDCRTADGVRIEVFGNVGSVAEARTAVACGAEGCGLLRTEFLFLERRSPPDEAEQRVRYQGIVDAFRGRPVVIRTLDAGGDKPIAYLPLPHEENPALGMRGVRTSLWQPDLLKSQLRALLAVHPVHACRVLLPMVTGPEEIRVVVAMMDELCGQLGITTRPQIGAMIETPASALLANEIAREADFLSIGTNDLTQYVLAMDRGHPELATRLDALHPAVLRLIRTATQGAAAHERPVAVCGGLASDPAATAILIGLGVRELSVVPAAIAGLKARVRGLTMARCVALAQEALKQESPERVRVLAQELASEERESTSASTVHS